MRDTVFFRQAELLLRILPLIHKEEVFALKGGTAINFFVRELPRLSVDIDLTYLPVNERDIALDDIGKTGNFIMTHAGDKTTGLSGVELDSSTFSGVGQAATDQAMLIGFVERTGNELGAHACWIVKIHNHYLNQANHA